MDDYEHEALMEAQNLRHEAEIDRLRAEQHSEDNPTYADYLERRAQHKRWLANNRDGGAGQ